jgi:alpha-galactosidase
MVSWGAICPLQRPSTLSMPFRPAARRRAVLLALSVALLSGTTGLRAGASVEVGDAFVRESSDGRQWEVGNAAVSYRLALDQSDTLTVEGLVRPDGESLAITGAGDAAFTIGDEHLAVGDRAFRFLAAEAADVDGRAVLTLAFGLRDRPVTVGRHYAVSPGAPIIEMWTSVHVEDDTTLRDLEGLRLEFTARDVWWHSGHDTPDGDGGPFTRRAARLDDGQHLEFGSAVLSSQEALPWFGLTSGDDHLVLGLAWSGGWRAWLDGTAAGTHVRLGLPDMSVVVRPGQPLEFPHAFLGVTGSGAGAEAATFATWIASRRHGRPFPSLVTYNTWFTFGTYIDADLARRQMDAFAAIGGELFQLDAGWYPPVNARDRFDFGAGLGSWQVDRERFPQGLGTLSDHARERGLKFAVWVEPERVDMATVGRPGQAREAYLAQQHGQYQPGRDNAAASHGQICLGDEEAWQWVRDRLFAFLDEARPDYLKIDLNGWLVCTRPDHDHTGDGGNFAHTQGLYRLLTALRERYPQMAIENCSGGARRLDAEMLTRTDANWMDDRTAPASRVRHHLQVLSAVVPPPALLSYLMGSEDESLTDPRDLALLARSRMPGVFGLTVDFRDVGADLSRALAAQIDSYKQLRALRGAPFAAALTAPVGVNGDGPGWDVVEQVNPSSGVATVFAFRNGGGDRRVRVRLAHLRPDVTYQVRSLDRGPIGRFAGADLMTDGVDLEASGSAAQVLIVEPQ